MARQKSSISGDAERRLNLSPQDWRRVRGPERGSLPPLTPERPFDLAALKVLGEQSLNQGGFAQPAVVTAEEARFWLYIYSTLQRFTLDQRQGMFPRLTAAPFREPMDLGDLKAAFDNLFYWECSLPILRMQLSWLSPADVVELTTSNPNTRMFASQASEMALWLEDEVFPRLDDVARETVRDRLRTLMQQGGEPALVAAVLARHAGMDADLTAFVAALKPGDLSKSKVVMGWASLLFGIKDAELMVREFRRLRLRLSDPADARAWLALTGHAELDVLRDSILAMRKGHDLLAMLDVLLLAESPEAAAMLREVQLKAKPAEARTRIEAWLEAHPAF